MNARSLLAQTLSLGLVHLTLTTAALPLPAASPHADLQQRVEQFGAGTELKIKLEGGEKLRGVVERVGEDGFVVSSNENGQREIEFRELRNVRYPKRGYKAEGTPDPILAKRMVVQLGVGEHIMVKVSPTQKVRGHIREIHADHFMIQPDGQGGLLKVPYGSVWKVNKNMSFGATIAIVVGIAAAVVLILVLSGEDEVDVLPD